jgi:polygalacturonase
MSVNLSPLGGAGAQFFTNDGVPLTGGLLYTYLAGTSTPATTYTSGSGITALANPIILDAAGRVPTGEIWISDGISYKFVLKDSTDVLIATWDGLSGINSNFIAYTSLEETATATAGQTVFDLTLDYIVGANSLAVFVNGSNQIVNVNYTETDSNTVTFLTGLNVGDVVKFSTATPVATNAVDAANVSYTPAGVGAVTTSVQAKLRESVSVKDFGAVGNGVTDDTAAIQAALDVGGTIYFPNGTYKITDSLYPDSDSHLIIDGTVDIPYHAYTAFQITNKTNVSITGQGTIKGYGIFPAKDISTIDGGGEKEYTVENSLVWPQGTNGNPTALGTFGGGYLGNGGHGVWIQGSTDVNVNIEIHGFNYAGVCIGNPTDNNNPAAVVSYNIKVSGYIHHCYNSGVTYSVCENVIISDLILDEIGHPDAAIGDATINPGYGTNALSMGALGIAAKYVTQGNITTRNCKRRGIDIHSGYYITTSNCNINNSWIAGVGGMVGGGYHGNLTFSNINISNSGTATTTAIDAPIAFAIGAPFSIVSNINIYESGRAYGIYVYADNVQISNTLINNPTYTAINRPFYAVSVTNLALDNFRVDGTFNDSIYLNAVTKSTLSNVNTTDSTFTTGDYDLEMTASEVYVASTNRWSRPQFNLNNTGEMEFRRSRVKIAYNGTATPTSTIINGSAYISSIAYINNYVYVYSLSSTDFAGTAEGASLGSFIARTDIGTADAIAYIGAGVSSSAGQLFSITGLFKDNTTRAATNSANLNGTSIVIDVIWTFQ